MPITFAPEDFDLVLDQFGEAACEPLDALIDADASVLDLRDQLIFMTGSLAGLLQANRLPMAKVNAACNQFAERLDAHVAARMPTHDASVWKHNVHLN